MLAANQWQLYKRWSQPTVVNKHNMPLCGVYTIFPFIQLSIWGNDFIHSSKVSLLYHSTIYTSLKWLLFFKLHASTVLLLCTIYYSVHIPVRDWILENRPFDIICVCVHLRPSRFYYWFNKWLLQSLQLLFT